MIVVHVAASIIERDALLNELAENGIDGVGEIRDVSRKLSDSTVDLAYEGYSAVMGGFTISVPSDEVDRAREIIENFLNKIKISGDLPLIRPSLQKFYASSIYSIFLPFVFHLSAIYYLVQGVKNREKIRPLWFIGSLVLFLLSGFLGVGLVLNLLK